MIYRVVYSDTKGEDFATRDFTHINLAHAYVLGMRGLFPDAKLRIERIEG